MRIAWIRAQVAAEVKERLRSTATLMALVAFFVLSFLWIPDPKSNAVSIAWQTTDGVTTSGVYNSAYVGTAAAILASLFLSLAGFYLVAGSVRRDAERGLGAILAATPLSKTAYLAGKLAGHFAYLGTVAVLTLASGIVVFLIYGTGPLKLGEFVVPFALLALPCLAFVAVLAVLFDVAPGLRGRGGLVIYFFVWSFGFFSLPILLHGGMERTSRTSGWPAYDPAGVALFADLLERSIPNLVPGKLSVGISVMDEPVRRVVWNGLRFSRAAVISRLTTFAWALVPFLLSVAMFDRFDPAKRIGRRTRPKTAPEPDRLTESRGAAVISLAAARQKESLLSLPPISPSPGLWRSVMAEARLIWELSGLLRWPLLATALAAAIPGIVGRVGAAAFLLLLAPVLSEVGAREAIHGSGGLVFSQPGVPHSTVLWKALSAILFVVALSLPRLVMTILSPQRELAFLLGGIFVAAFAIGAGVLTGGGKLFTGLYVALLYAAANGPPVLDFAGAFAPQASLAVSSAYLAGGLGLLALAELRGRRVPG
jgi:hypothetical protein